jgi:hypothetical protein
VAVARVLQVAVVITSTTLLTTHFMAVAKVLAVALVEAD